MEDELIIIYDNCSTDIPTLIASRADKHDMTMLKKIQGDEALGIYYYLVGGTDMIITPPCKVGDTVWRVDDVWHLDDKETWTYHYEKEVVEYVVRSILISCNSKGKWTKKFRICEVRNGKIIDRQRDIEFDDFGKIVFPIREEAEIALMEALKNNGKEGMNT